MSDFLSFIVPMLNEEKYIEQCLLSILKQKYPKNGYEIIVVDGGSKDYSREIVSRFAIQNNNIKLLGDIGINCPAAMNIGIMNSSPKSSTIIKVDAHGYLSKNYIKIGLPLLFESSGTKCVGGVIASIPNNNIERANSLARSSYFGVGGGVYTFSKGIENVQSVQCGIYKKEIFQEVGYFDENLQFGEDEELNWRIIKHSPSGIIATKDIQFNYHPRPTFGSLFRQYRNYGVARVKVIQKHTNFLMLKHFIPSIFILSLLILSILSIWMKTAQILLLFLLSCYLLLTIGFSIVLSKNKNKNLIFLIPISFICLHFGYGFGVIEGLLSLRRNDFERRRI